MRLLFPLQVVEPYDGFELAEDYEMKLAEKERKAKENAEKKAKKIAKDKEIRERKKEIAEKGEQPFFIWVKMNIRSSRPVAC